MTTKRVMFAVMCVLLVVVIVMTGIVISQISQLFQSVVAPKPSTGTTSVPAGSSASTSPTVPTSKPTEPSTVPTTQPPTTVPTEPAHVHDFVLTESTEPTCETYGYNIYTCSICGRQDIPYEEQRDPYGHNFGAGEVIEPTCTDSGCTRYTCGRCGMTEERNPKDALGHNLEFAETVPGTCEETGYDLHRCSRCSLEERGNEVPAIGHSFEPTGEPTAPTCTEDGHVPQQCTVCGLEQEEVIPATGHAFSDWAAADDGSLSRSCGNCGLVETSYQLRITNEQISVSENDGKMYIIYVGTDSEPEIYHCIIYDHLNNGTLRYALDPVRGLVVTYTDGTGETVEIVQDFFDNQDITIPAG